MAARESQGSGARVQNSSGQCLVVRNITLMGVVMEATITERIASNPSPRTLRGRFQIAFSTLKYNRAAFIESGKLVFAVIGLGTVLADFSTIRYWFILPGVLLFAGFWFGIYTQMEGV